MGHLEAGPPHMIHLRQDYSPGMSEFLESLLSLLWNLKLHISHTRDRLGITGPYVMCALRLLAPLDLDQSFCLIPGPWKDPYICLLELEHLGSDKRDSDPSVPFQQSREFSRELSVAKYVLGGRG